MTRYVLLGVFLCASCREAEPAPQTAKLALSAASLEVAKPRPAGPDPVAALIHAALERTQHKVKYTPAYVSIGYPNGDVPASTGVCTDVIIRTYRAIGIDLQMLVHFDMAAAFDQYPTAWGLTRPDRNIDHRRVPNLRTFFTRHGEKLRRSKNPADYAPGDIVTWDVGRNGKHVDHIGIVVNVMSEDQERMQVVHNIGPGPAVEDVLFRWPITGHFRYLPADVLAPVH